MSKEDLESFYQSMIDKIDIKNVLMDYLRNGEAFVKLDLESDPEGERINKKQW